MRQQQPTLISVVRGGPRPRTFLLSLWPVLKGPGRKYRVLGARWLSYMLDPKFAQDSESGLKSAQSPAGKDENCMQSPVS
eukprot:SAG25_NODE_899_length_4862_cov_4.370893_4_plen_80_part_00